MKSPLTLYSSLEESRVTLSDLRLTKRDPARNEGLAQEHPQFGRLALLLASSTRSYDYHSQLCLQVYNLPLEYTFEFIATAIHSNRQVSTRNINYTIAPLSRSLHHRKLSTSIALN